ncbi:MAG TPA: S41 family peptidase [Candidatus Nanoarchaeia archaeon]|nr:putative CtpA-like serine protease [uncultured archaeon]
MAEKAKQFNQFFPKLVVSLFLLGLGIWVGRNVSLPFLPEGQPKYDVLNKLYSKDNVDFAPFWQTWDELNSKFLDKKTLEGDKLLQGALRGLVEAAGDPYTSYFDPESNQTFNSELAGTFEGVGIELGVKDNQLVVISPLEGSPAEKNGVLAGDRIVKIDGKDAAKLSIAEAVKLIRGKASTKVKLAVVRGEADAEHEFEITRETITIKTVKLVVDGEIGIVRINRFGDNTNKEWDSVVNEIATKGISKLVLDVRNNPGGRLDSAIYVASEFLKKADVVVMQEDADGKRQSFYSDRDGRLRGVELVVLINKGSASASEIVAGALKDQKKAKVVGEASFGKGTVQSVVDLKDGSGLHITVAKWLTPSGVWVHGKGLEPDVKVELTEEDIAAGSDPQLSKAKELLK